MLQPAYTIAQDAPLASSSPSSSGCLQELAEAREQGAAVLLVCDHSLEGVMSAIGLSYLSHMDPNAVRLCSNPSTQPMLAEKTILCPSAYADDVLALAQRVYAGVSRSVTSGCSNLRGGTCPARCDAACLSRMDFACAADDPRMPEIVHRFVRLAFSQGARIRTLSTHEHVVALDELARYTLNECERTRQFMRFKKLSNDSFLGVFRPKANTVPLVSRHFAERMQQDRFCMVDPDHLVAAFHEKGMRSCSIVRVDPPLAHALIHNQDLAENEAYLQAMWKHFYDSLALGGRDASQRGYDLRAHWIPKRLWAGLPELWS